MSEPALAASGPALPTPATTLKPVPAAAPAHGETATARLELPEYDLERALLLERELGISHTLSQILVRRGFDEVYSARQYLTPSELHDAGAFRGIETAVEVIERHLRAGSRIIVHGDYDVDGVCATAIMVRALRSLEGSVDWFLPDRLSDGYGLSRNTVARLSARGADLLITVDCGITSVEEVAAARAAGLDVVVTDHHARAAGGMLPACAILHPAICDYPCRDLCGSGVAHKLAHALGAPSAAEDIELVALATVADLMPLRGENRTLVRDGMRALARTAKPGLRALMMVTRSDPSALDTGVLGFRLAPRINAAGRVRRADAALELLLTEDPRRAEEIAAELEELNVERRAIEQRISWEAEAQAERLGDRFALVLAGERWHPGVIGVVASRIAERHHRPAILVAIDDERPARGSGRSIPGFDLLEALRACSDHLEGYGGHRAAAGLTIRPDRLEAFGAAIDDYARAALTPELLEPLERADAVVSGTALGLELAEELEALEPCGVGNPSARLLVPGARFDQLRPMGEGRHARFTVSSGGARARAVAFGCNGRLQAEPGEPVDATFRLERNFWNGAVEPRLVLRHARRCSAAPVKVVGEPDDYLRSVLEELDTVPEPWEAPEAADDRGAGAGRTLHDRRGESPLAVLSDALATGGSVLAVCADVPRRVGGLTDRLGGFSLGCYHGLTRGRLGHERFQHVVALDPPACGFSGALLQEGSGHTHWAWGAAELRFAQQMHELEYGLRTSLAALYRGLRLRQRVLGEELERLLRGDGPHVRPARLAARLIRVLAELELVSLDRDLPALALAGETRVALERSPAYRMYAQRYEDGQRYLSSANLLPSG